MNIYYIEQNCKIDCGIPVGIFIKVHNIPSRNFENTVPKIKIIIYNNDYLIST